MQLIQQRFPQNGFYDQQCSHRPPASVGVNVAYSPPLISKSVTEDQPAGAALSSDIAEANDLAATIMRKYNWDLLDAQFWFKDQSEHRQGDGIHWNAKGFRNKFF